jgi:hypothetical protein
LDGLQIQNRKVGAVRVARACEIFAKTESRSIISNYANGGERNARTVEEGAFRRNWGEIPRRHFLGDASSRRARGRATLGGMSATVRPIPLRPDPDAVATAMTTEERDRALTELQAAGVIARAGFNDANGNPAYRLLKFPPGEEGERLKALFDRHVRGRNCLDDSAPLR